jgi:protein-S-isoprenylcysteine O-methyltransferase Ste14
VPAPLVAAVPLPLAAPVVLPAPLLGTAPPLPLVWPVAPAPDALPLLPDEPVAAEVPDEELADMPVEETDGAELEHAPAITTVTIAAHARPERDIENVLGRSARQMYEGTERRTLLPVAANTTRKAMVGLAELVVVMGLLLFVPAGTLKFVQGWIFLALFSGSSLAITVYLMDKDPKLLERRTQAGPVAETELSQKIIQGLASIAFISTIVVPALDHRLHWSRAPLSAVAMGDVLVFLGFLTIFFVFKENTFTSSVIEVAADQRVIDSGPYAIVRHPMYSGALVLIAGVPLALGSLVGLATFVPFVACVVWRLLDEERFLSIRLVGYSQYREKTRYRLIPHIW